MKTYRVAVLTLDDDYKKPLKDYLVQERIQVDIYQKVHDCVSMNKYLNYDLFIVDYVLEDYNGYFFTSFIRRSINAPIIFISYDYEEASVVRAFDLGVDEYLKKPVRLKELTVRCVALLNKYNNQLANKIIKINGVVYDKIQNKVFLNDTEVLLTPTEMKLLKILMDKAGESISSKELLNSV